MNFYRLLKHLSNKEGQKRLDSDKKPTTDGIKFTSKNCNSKNSRSNWLLEISWNIKKFVR